MGRLERPRKACNKERLDVFLGLSTHTGRDQVVRVCVVDKADQDSSIIVESTGCVSRRRILGSRLN